MSVLHHQPTINEEQAAEITHIASRVLEQMREKLEQEVLRLSRLVPHSEMYIHFYAQYILLPPPGKEETLNPHVADREEEWEKPPELVVSTDKAGEARAYEFTAGRTAPAMDDEDDDMSRFEDDSLPEDAISRDGPTAHDSDKDNHLLENNGESSGLLEDRREEAVNQSSGNADDGWPDMNRPTRWAQDSLCSLEVNMTSDVSHDAVGLEDLTSSGDDDSLSDDSHDETPGRTEPSDTSDDEESSDWTEYTAEEMATSRSDGDPFALMDNAKRQDSAEEATSVGALTMTEFLEPTKPETRANLLSSAQVDGPPRPERVFVRVKHPLPPVPPHGLCPYTPESTGDRQVFADYLAALGNLATTLRVAAALRARRERIMAQRREAKFRWNYRFETRDPATGAVVYLDSPRSVRKDCGRRSRLCRVCRPEEFGEWGCYIRSHLDVEW